MTRWLHPLSVPDLARGLAALALWLTAVLPAGADDGSSHTVDSRIAPASYESQFDRFETEIIPTPAAVAECPPSANDKAFGASRYTVGYDNGFVISPLNPEESPFELRVNMQDQLRYTAFARDVSTWTDNAGNVAPVTDRSDLALTRGRLIFAGFALQPELTYFLNIDYNTVGSSQINFRSYGLGYQFHRGLSLHAGQFNVPGSRDWLTPFLYTLGADRSVATTFFRPSLSTGLWAIGEPLDGWYYHAMLANGFNTLGANVQEQSSSMTLSASVWYEPLGKFGVGSSDFEWHDDPAVRLGGSFTYSPIQGQQGNPDLPENVDIRLSDGTVLTDVGALAPGIALSTYTVALGAFDLAFKYRGFSLCGELYLRELFKLQGNGPLPRTSIFDFGGFVQAGFYAIPQQFELFSRSSVVTGPYGTGSEYAGGFNWYFLRGQRNLRYTFDATWLDNCPTEQSRTGYNAGDTGLLIRSQIQVFF